MVLIREYTRHLLPQENWVLGNILSGLDHEKGSLLNLTHPTLSMITIITPKCIADFEMPLLGLQKPWWRLNPGAQRQCRPVVARHRKQRPMNILACGVKTPGPRRLLTCHL